ncbi:MAG TPA: amidohydrolase family protein [Flavobacteriaceae bacterium]|nr:amidohydrolase [Flavobacteriaceae bacterium]HIB49341.1 amidohydrolase family protein [Flavobacteriaceae bacterium]HIN99227.1 amidohydrolase family protein [Flavobacteriaceae bacterium]|tara:strand:+ start:200 stop:1477 length:1278 start_codon:yes stop_codon:yes gene_type:complete
MRLLLLLLFISQISLAQDTYLHCGKVFDAKNGTIQNNKTIVVSGTKIKSIEDGFVASRKKDDITIDLRDKTVLPGLIDMHVHIESETSPDNYVKPFTLNEADVAFNAADIAKRTLMAGFTTVRDLGGSGVNVALRNAIAKGKVPGPRIYTAEKAIATTGGHADPTNGRKKELMGDPGPAEGVINGPVEARKAVRQRYKNGADCIKITATGGVLSVSKNGHNPQFTQEELNEIVKTANEYGMSVAAHAHGIEGMKRAIKAGVLTIEHGSLMDLETAQLMKQYGTYLVPTLSAGRYVAEKAKVPGYYPEIIIPKIVMIDAQLKETFAMVSKEGVNIAFGTDAGVFPHGDNAKEFRYMVESGWSPVFALQSATLVNAKLLDMENELGQLAVGFIADIVAVNEDPTQTIETMENVVFVMKEGKIYNNLP